MARSRKTIYIAGTLALVGGSVFTALAENPSPPLQPPTSMPLKGIDPKINGRLPTEPDVRKFLNPPRNPREPTAAPHVEELRLYDGHPVLVLIDKPSGKQGPPTIEGRSATDVSADLLATFQLRRTQMAHDRSRAESTVPADTDK